MNVSGQADFIVFERRRNLSRPRGITRDDCSHEVRHPLRPERSQRDEKVQRRASFSPPRTEQIPRKLMFPRQAFGQKNLPVRERSLQGR